MPRRSIGASCAAVHAGALVAGRDSSKAMGGRRRVLCAVLVAMPDLAPSPYCGVMGSS